MIKIGCLAKHIITKEGNETITNHYDGVTVSYGDYGDDFVYLTICEEVDKVFNELELRLNPEDARILALLLTNAADKVEKGGTK